MARYALAAGSKETPPFIRMAAVRPAVVVSPLAAQHFLNFVPLPHGHGSFRPTVIYHSFGRTIRITDPAPLVSDLKLRLHRDSVQPDCYMHKVDHSNSPSLKEVAAPLHKTASPFQTI